MNGTARRRQRRGADHPSFQTGCHIPLVVALVPGLTLAQVVTDAAAECYVRNIGGIRFQDSEPYMAIFKIPLSLRASSFANHERIPQ